MTGGSPYAQYLDPYQQAMLAYGGGNPAAQPQAATMPGPPGQPGTRGLGPDGQPNASKSGVNSWGSLLGNIGGVVGLGIPGIGGMALGPAANLAGSFIDAQNANRGLATQGLPTGVTAGPAALSNGMFGLLGALGLGSSIRDQIGGIKDDAARNDPRFGGVIPGSQTSFFGPGTKSWATDPMNFDQNSPTKDFGPGGFGSTGADTGGGISTSGGQDPGSGGKGESRGGGDKGEGGGGWYAKGGKVRPPGYAGGGVVGRAGGEAAFQNWFRGLPWFQEFTQQYGEEPNARDPDYNYRRAYRAGVEPERYAPDANRYHWPSVTPAGDDLKGANHPTRWMEEFMQQNGRDPNEMDGPFQQGYAGGGEVGRAAGRAHRDAQPVQNIIPDYMTETDPPGSVYRGPLRDNAGVARNIQELMDRIEMGQARNAPVTGPLDPVPDRPGYAKGGRVKATPATMHALGKIDPPGPDDQVAGLQTGEGVINRPAMKAGWGEMLDIINSNQGGALAQLLRGLLK